MSFNPSANRSINSLNNGLDVNQLNQILRNPELPKNRFQINNILKKYNEQKRRVITLSRIQCTTNSTLLNTSSQKRCPQSSETLLRNDLTDFEVKLSHLPQDLITILSETNESNKTKEDSDEDDCIIIDDFEDIQTNDNLKQKLQHLINEYKQIESQEMSAFNQLETVSQQLETKLSELRECIDICDRLKDENIKINENCNQLKEKKNKLSEEIDKIKDHLIESKPVIHNKTKSSKSDVFSKRKGVKSEPFRKYNK